MHDPYQPPASASSESGPGWFRSRPLAVYPAALLSATPLAFAVWMSVFRPELLAWSLLHDIDNAMRTVSNLLQVALLFVAGLCLAYLRKVATWLYALVFVLWGLRSAAEMLGAPEESPHPLFLAVMLIPALPLAYSLSLHVRGRLR